jgi:hypothetical protein
MRRRRPAEFLVFARPPESFDAAIPQKEPNLDHHCARLITCAYTGSYSSQQKRRD